MTLLGALGRAWGWYRNERTDLPLRIAYRTGQVFMLNDGKIVRFEKCRFHGYFNEDLTYKYLFNDKEFGVAVKE